MGCSVTGAKGTDALESLYLFLEMSEECCRRSFGASLIDTAKRLIEDPRVAPPEIQAQRLETCRECPSFKDGRCELCGCVMTLKVRFGNVRCPAGYWTEYEE